MSALIIYLATIDYPVCALYCFVHSKSARWDWGGA
uniref:Uncharacterized protein n=1 Tax=Arundo donax TaxID=35708 RepID=A0A0A9AYQ2_ARUDO